MAGPWRIQEQEESENGSVHPSGFHHAAFLSHSESQFGAAATGLESPLQFLPDKRSVPGVFIQEQLLKCANHLPLLKEKPAHHVFFFRNPAGQEHGRTQTQQWDLECKCGQLVNHRTAGWRYNSSQEYRADSSKSVFEVNIAVAKNIACKSNNTAFCALSQSTG